MQLLVPLVFVVQLYFCLLTIGLAISNVILIKDEIAVICYNDLCERYYKVTFKDII